MKNFQRPKNEKPYYYSSTVENGKIIKHEGDPNHAMYKSEIAETSRRANLWHKWVENNFENAYNGFGVIDEDIRNNNIKVLKQFMDGERNE